MSLYGILLMSVDYIGKYLGFYILFICFSLKGHKGPVTCCQFMEKWNVLITW